MRRSPTHPGEVLAEMYLKPLRLSAAKLAERTGIPLFFFRRILAGDSRITAEAAIRIASSPQLWLNLQQNYELWHAARKLLRSKWKPPDKKSLKAALGLSSRRRGRSSRKVA